MAKKGVYVAIRLSNNKQRYVAGNRYLNWVDNNWYCTTDTPMYLFHVNQIPVIKEQLKKHFINSCEFITKDGNNVIWDAFNPTMVQVFNTQSVEPEVEHKKVNGISFIFKKSSK